MADSPQMPGGHAWPPKTPQDAAAWFRFFRSLLATVSAAGGASAGLAAVNARLDALEQSGGSGSLTGIRSVRVDGSLGSGATVQLRGDSTTPDPAHYYGTDKDGARGWHELPAGGAPTFIAADETFRVPANTQILFSMPITCDGYLVVDGYLIGV